MAFLILMWNQSAENENPGRALGVSTIPRVVVSEVSGRKFGLPSRFQVQGSLRSAPLPGVEQNPNRPPAPITSEKKSTQKNTTRETRDWLARRRTSSIGSQITDAFQVGRL